MNYLKPDLHIEQPMGVAPAFDDTLTLSVLASKEPKGKVLDVGTGTGYIAIYLAKLGFDVDGTDINKSAISTARRNAEKNNVKCKFFVSDLFSEIKNKYNLIVFNPPLNDEKSNTSFDILKSLVRKYRILTKISKPIGLYFFKKHRISILTKFLSSVDKYMAKNGKVLLLLNKSEVSWCKDLIPTIFKTERLTSPIRQDDHIVLRLSFKK